MSSYIPKKIYIPVEKMSTRQYLDWVKQGGGAPDPKMLEIIKNNKDNQVLEIIKKNKAKK